MAAAAADDAGRGGYKAGTATALHVKLLSWVLQGLWWLPSIADADRLQPLKGGLAMAAAAADNPDRGPRKLVKLQLFMSSL